MFGRPLRFGKSSALWEIEGAGYTRGDQMSWPNLPTPIGLALATPAVSLGAVFSADTARLRTQHKEHVQVAERYRVARTDGERMLVSAPLAMRSRARQSRRCRPGSRARVSRHPDWPRSNAAKGLQPAAELRQAAASRGGVRQESAAANPKQVNGDIKRPKDAVGRP